MYNKDFDYFQGPYYIYLQKNIINSEILDKMVYNIGKYIRYIIWRY